MFFPDVRESHLAREVSNQGGSKPQRTGEAKLARISFLRGKLPRAYCWLRTDKGVARRVTILFVSAFGFHVMTYIYMMIFGGQREVACWLVGEQSEK